MTKLYTYILHSLTYIQAYICLCMYVLHYILNINMYVYLGLRIPRSELSFYLYLVTTLRAGLSKQPKTKKNTPTLFLCFDF